MPFSNLSRMLIKSMTASPTQATDVEGLNMILEESLLELKSEDHHYCLLSSSDTLYNQRLGAPEAQLVSAWYFYSLGGRNE